MESSNQYAIEAGLPQGSILLPFLSLIYTYDFPITGNSTTATFADSVAILSIHEASANLQTHLNEIYD